MNRFLTLLSILTCFASAACTSQEAASPPAPVKTFREPSAIQAPYLFRAEKNGRTSYLFGTIHLGVKAAELPPSVFDAIEKTPYFATEDGKTSTAESPPRTNANTWATLSATDRERFLSLPLVNGNEELARKLVNAQDPRRLCIAWSMLSLFEMEELKKGITLLDVELTRFAEKQQKPVLALDRNDLVERHSAKFEAECRSEVFGRNRTAADMRNEFWQAVVEYREGDLRTAQDDEDPILYERNRSWIAKIERNHERGGVFATFGADHLGGENGVIRLLEDRGFRVLRVEN
jgi:uncharacterized protein YbaP (TraB family)